MAERTYTIIHGDSAQELKHIPDNSIDAVVTDPPYGIEFLGKDWDSNTGAVAIWAECHRILKPGGYLLAFSAARTYHHLASNIESVGFEIRDQLMWIYSSGFPKAQDMGRAIEKRKGNSVSHFEYRKQKGNTRSVESHSNGTSPYCPLCKKFTITRCDQCPPEPTNEWSGWKTALKPGHEPIVMARKPFRGSTIDNVLKHGVGALNIDATRIGNEIVKTVIKRNEENSLWYGKRADDQSVPKQIEEKNNMGRFPSNVMGDIPEYQKYFYCPKVTRRERHCGFEQHQIPDPLQNYQQGDVKNHPLWDPSIGTNLQRLKHKILEHEKSLGRQHTVTGAVGNNHPTVKPVALMRYLIQLVTPPGSHIIDPFTGSGTTGMAATELGHRFTGIEQDPQYVEIANKRIAGWLSKIQDTDTAKEHTAKDHTATDPFDRLFE